MARGKLSRRAAPTAPDAIGKERVVRGRKKRVAEQRAVKKEFVARELSRISAEAEAKRGALRARDAVRASGPALAVMGGLGDALGEVERKVPEVVEERREGKIVRIKARRRILAQEAAQVKNVLAHPGFVKDPMEALRQHLMNTVSSCPEEVPPAVDEGKGRRKKKGKHGKGSEGGDEGAAADLAGATAAVARMKKTAREAVVKKREHKQELATAAAAIKKRKGGRVVKQTFGAPRGRIGVARPKI